LAISHALRERGVEHLVLERGRIGETWRSERWDSFTVVTPTWATALPGLPHEGREPGDFLTLPEWLAYLDRYVARFSPPVREGIAVRRLWPASGGRFCLETDEETIEASVLIVATGFFRTPIIPPFAGAGATAIQQLPSSRYRNPDGLPAGAVLVVGTGQSGIKIAEELLAAGRRVYLSVGRVGRTPRRYRGRDSMWWRQQPGFAAGGRDRPASYSHMTGKDGGRDLNLHQFARDGMHLLGRIVAIADGSLVLAPDLHERLAAADAADLAFRRAADRFAAERRLDLPPDPLPDGEQLRDGFAQPILTRLELRAAGITSIVWATGFRPDYSWIDFPVFDAEGRPVSEGGVTAIPGLFFAGVRWQLPGTTTLIGGLGAEAVGIASHIERRLGVRRRDDEGAADARRSWPGCGAGGRLPR
jgi:putative flavoprotein involved in K+ transport